MEWWAKSLTSHSVEPIRDAGEEGEGDEVSEAGCNGRGHIVRVNVEELGDYHHSDHHTTQQGAGQTRC